MTATTAQLAAVKEKARATWAAGDYDTMAQPLWPAGARVVAATAAGPGDEVLDVACGTGNAAVQAAQAGARVTGVDLTPELLDIARSRAAAAGVDVDFRQGDAEDLPFADERFDVVLSTFGCMFPPRHDVVTAELVRVLRPGGRLGICAWTPKGAIGELFGTVSRHLPPAPSFAASPLMWGDEGHVRELFAGSGVRLHFSRAEVEFRYESVEHEVEQFETKFGPILKARELLEPQGRWEALHEDLVAYARRHSGAPGASVAFGEYLMTVGTKGAA